MEYRVYSNPQLVLRRLQGSTTTAWRCRGKLRWPITEIDRQGCSCVTVDIAPCGSRSKLSDLTCAPPCISIHHTLFFSIPSGSQSCSGQDSRLSPREALRPSSPSYRLQRYDVCPKLSLRISQEPAFSFCLLASSPPSRPKELIDTPP